MSYPSTALTTHVSDVTAPTRILFEQILTFCNEWGPIFDEGPNVDCSSVILDTMSGYCKLAVSDISDFQRSRLYFQDEMHNIQQDFQSYIQKIEEVGNAKIRDFENRLEEYKIKFQKSLKEDFKQFEEDCRCRIEELFEEKYVELESTIEKKLKPKKHKVKSQHRRKKRYS
jgi:hypothetical protein